MDLTLASVVMAFSQILPRDLAQLLRQLSDDDLLQLSLTTAQGPPTFRLLEFGLILRRERQRRLLERHMRFGREREDALRWIAITDEPNARLVAASKQRADWVIEQTT